MIGKHSFKGMCRSLGKDPLYIRNLQRGLALPIPATGEGYPEGYLRFLDKVIALRTFSVPQARIVELLESEKKILKLLHVDSFSNSKTWYMDLCCLPGQTGYCLLLTGYDMGFPLASHDTGEIQHHLNFNSQTPELFSGSEMGEDVRDVLRAYLDQLEKIMATVEKEKAVLENALDWVTHFAWRE